MFNKWWFKFNTDISTAVTTLDVLISCSHSCLVLSCLVCLSPFRMSYYPQREVAQSRKYRVSSVPRSSYSNMLVSPVPRVRLVLDYLSHTWHERFAGGDLASRTERVPKRTEAQQDDENKSRKILMRMTGQTGEIKKR